ncbi:MAG: M1 family metallopeptidase [Clostridia bacterium]|nr:M1 family metallopeptidase [Clostridia bacterium]
MAGKRCIILPLRSKRGRWAALGALLLAICALIWLFRPRQTTPPPPSEALTAAAKELTDYDVTLKLIPERRQVSITERVAFINDTGDTLTSLLLRTWLNAFQSEEDSPAATEELYDACYPQGFSEGKLTLHDVAWNGTQTAWRYDDDAQTALRVDIPPLAAGQTGELLLRCVVQIPLCAHRSGGLGDTYQLGNVIPQLSLYQDHAWRADPYTSVGDPFVSSCANYTFSVYLPEGYVPACSAPLTRGQDGAWRGSILAARDVALCLSPDYCQASARAAGGAAVYAYAKTEAGARRVAEDAKRAIDVFSGLFGPYPYPALTVCAVDFPFGGMEYSGLVMIGQSNFLDSQQDTMELTVAHETAHQWFYSLVGSDQVYAPWQDEALCQYAMLRYVRARYGQGSFDTLKYYQVDSPMAENIPGSLTPGSPIDYFGDLTAYSSVVYGRGAALLLALDEMLPGGADAFLRAYAEAFAYRFATRQDFEAFLNNYAGMDCSPLLLDYLDTAH